MRPRGDRGTAKAVGAWMPGDFPRSPGSCCHGPLKTLGTLAPWPVSCPEKLTEPRPPPPHPAAPHPCTDSSRPRSIKEREREKLRRTIFSWKDLSYFLWQNIYFSACIYHLQVRHTYVLRVLIFLLYSCWMVLYLWGLSQNVICSGKHEGQPSVVLNHTSVLGFEYWLSTS